MNPFLLDQNIHIACVFYGVRRQPARLRDFEIGHHSGPFQSGHDQIHSGRIPVRILEFGPCKVWSITQAEQRSHKSFACLSPSADMDEPTCAKCFQVTAACQGSDANKGFTGYVAGRQIRHARQEREDALHGRAVCFARHNHLVIRKREMQVEYSRIKAL